MHRTTCLEFNPATLTLASGSTDKTVKYWDLENFQNISVTPESEEINHMSFYEDNSELLFAASNENYIKLWNVENNR